MSHMQYCQQNKRIVGFVNLKGKNCTASDVLCVISTKALIQIKLKEHKDSKCAVLV